MDTVLKEIFAKASKTSNEKRDMIPAVANDCLLHDLMNLFPTSTVLDALDLIDRRAVTKSHCPSGRTAFQIDGNAGKSYRCFGSSVYCTCPSHAFAVLRRGDKLMCKHVLAARMADALNMCVSTEVSDHAMSAQLQQIIDTQAKTT